MFSTGVRKRIIANAEAASKKLFPFFLFVPRWEYFALFFLFPSLVFFFGLGFGFYLRSDLNESDEARP